MTKRKTKQNKPPDQTLLTFLETWAFKQPAIKDVPIIPALNYDLIQLLNRQEAQQNG